VANAVSRSDQFDFLIDIVPREEPPKPSHKKSSTREDVAPEVKLQERFAEKQTGLRFEAMAVICPIDNLEALPDICFVSFLPGMQ
jgi:hypothetical protein